MSSAKFVFFAYMSTDVGNGTQLHGINPIGSLILFGHSV